MHSKLTILQRVTAFERLLEALGRELIESTDEELLGAARELGMDPTTRGSAAFAGLKYPATPQVSDFFDVPMSGLVTLLPPAGKRLSGRKCRSKAPLRGKPDRKS